MNGSDARPEPPRAGDEAELDRLAKAFDRFVEGMQEGEGFELGDETAGLGADEMNAYELARRVVPRQQTSAPGIAGYRILHELGRGGMGVVYLARQERLGRDVALKVLPLAYGRSTRAQRRFLDEARALAGVRDDHIVQIHDVIDTGDTLAYAMEWVDGMSLRSLLDALRDAGRPARLVDVARLLGADEEALRARNPLDYFVGMAIAIARALVKVHAAGLVHRDVKPSNILIRRDGHPLLADFGLVRGSDSSVTGTRGFVGTPAYAAPEQLRGSGEELDARADLYSLAVTLYEAISLQLPVERSDTTELLRRIETGQVRRLRKLAPSAPRDLETILHRAMEPERRDRYGSLAEFADDLERLLHFEPVRARPPGLLERAAKLLRRQRRTLIAAGLGAVLVGAVTLPLLLEQRHATGLAMQHAAALREARLHLLSFDVLQQIRRYRALETAAPASANAGLDGALDCYARAIRLVPGDLATRLERDVVAVVRSARPGAADAAPEPAWERLRVSCPLTARRIGQLLAGPGRERIAGETIAAASELDRRMLGLLAFLTGDVELCEASWGGLDPARAGQPLADAALGILYLADNRPARAYSKLLTAWQSFPDTPLLAAALADAALSAGFEPALAEDWLGRAAVTADNNTDSALEWRRIHADLLTATGDLDAARDEYLEILPGYTRFPRACLHLARLDLLLGDLDEASSLLHRLVREWPHEAEYRLWLARAALEREKPDLAGYLAQARYVLAADFGASRSVGAVRDLLAILQVGGLDRLLEAGQARTGVRLSTSATGPLPGFWSRTGVFSSQQEVEALLERLALFDKAGREGPMAAGRESGWTARLTSALSLCSRLAIFFPETLLMFDSPSRLLITTAAGATRACWPMVATRWLPALALSLGLAELPRAQHNLWSTYYGGSQLGSQEAVFQVHLDRQGLVTVTGITDNANLPVTTNGHQTTFGGAYDVFVARFDPSRSGSAQLLWGTFLGGVGEDFVFDMHVDDAGLVTLAGLTRSTDFPVTSGALQTQSGGGNDGFLAVLDPSAAPGAQLVYSTYLGGTQNDRICALAVDAAGVATIAGYTRSSAGFPTTPGTLAPTYRGGAQDAFVARIDRSLPAAQQLLWSSYLGGSGQEGNLYPYWAPVHLDWLDLCVDGAGVTVFGYTLSTDFPTTPGCYQSAFAGGNGDAFVARLDNAGTGLLYSSYLGGSDLDIPYAADRHPECGYVVVGQTGSTDLPMTSNAFSQTPTFGGDAFVAWLDPGGNGAQDLRYSTLLGGDGGQDAISDVVVDSAGLVTVCGATEGGSFPTTPGAFQTQPTSAWNCMVARFELRSRGSRDLLYSGYVDGPGNGLDAFIGLCLDPDGGAVLGGLTDSPSYPLQNPYQPSLSGTFDCVIVHLDMLPVGVSGYGASTPGCAGTLPILVNSMPQIGNADFALLCGNAPPSSPGLLVLSGGRYASPATVYGAQVWVDLASPVYASVFVTSSPLGAGDFGMPLPASPGLSGLQLFAQFGWFDACASGGVSASRALAITLQ